MKHLFLAALTLGATATFAQAHATLQVAEAASGSYYKGIVQIGHGCDGQATLNVRVTLPEGFISVKPMPKAGWSLETVTGDYAQAYDNHGTAVTSGVREIIWTGELPDAWYDEFAFRGKIDASVPADSTLWFKTVQTCADGTQEWVEIPAEGQAAQDLKKPAPGLKITAGAHAHH